uniref:Uncharacterized protein n=1 Tax=Sinocyclocheilus grahami TaxID=75366 RepID=A0A672MYP8_SINGR
MFSFRWEHWKLLSNLKTTVEGLLFTNNPNVWSRYGGLQRLHKDMNNILGHSLKHEQTYYKQKDYWRFVWCVRYLCPHLARHVEQVFVSPVNISHMKLVLTSSVRFLTLLSLSLHRQGEKLDLLVEEVFS